MVIMVLPFVSSEIACWIRCSFSGSMLAVASSRMTMSASLRMARAMEMRCFSPPERVPPPPSPMRHDEVVAAGLFGGSDHLILRGVGPAEENVGADGVVEQIHILEHHGDIGKQTVAGELTQIVAAEGDAAALGVIETGQQAANGSLAAAGGTDDGGGGLFRDGETHIS